MLTRRLAMARPFAQLMRTPIAHRPQIRTPITHRPQIRYLSQADVEQTDIKQPDIEQPDIEDPIEDPDIEDPDMSGGYISPPRIPRQFGDPYADVEDPGMNGGYINPPWIPRQFRDPYADWWDKQERRNYGEPVHEDNDILGVFSPHEYTHFTPGWGAVYLGMFVATFMGVVAVARANYPDMPAVKRGFEGGLDRELGGEGTVWARTEDGID